MDSLVYYGLDYPYKIFWVDFIYYYIQLYPKSCYYIIKGRLNMDEYQTRVGELLAAGWSEIDIVKRLEEEGCEQPKLAIRAVYDAWKGIVRETLSDDDDLMQWHIYLRKRLLNKAMLSTDLAVQRFALAILDSLAIVQGIGKTTGPKLTAPLQVILVPKGETNG
jgi:hypothetical protein